MLLFAMSRAQADGDMTAVMTYMDEFYFESAAMILTLITVGKMLEAKIQGQNHRCPQKPYEAGASGGDVRS